MKRYTLLFSIGLLVSAATAFAGGEIYGTIYTDRGDKLTGPIRWDKNENFWDDILDADKPDKYYSEGRQGTIRIFGIEINKSGAGWRSSELNLPFGDIASIEPMSRNRAEITLKNGEVLKIKANSSDLGPGMRGLSIRDEVEGEVELDWDDVDRIEFSSGPGVGLDNERLYGTVETSGGDFTGYIVWDRDEALLDDILDGDEDGRRRKIPFRKIESIERRGSWGCRVTVAGERSVDLEGTNDVDDGNRGIDITIPGLGLVKVDWDDFDMVTFKPAPPSRKYDDFDGGKLLQGTVTDEDGDTYTGTIVWDNDEDYTWDVIDGEQDDIDYEIPFRNIRTITRESRRSAEIVTVGGTSLLLRGSNDVDRDNKGIRITMPDGDEVELDWYEFESAEFKDR